MKNESDLVGVYLAKIFKECTKRNIKPKELKNIKVVVTLIFKHEEETSSKDIEGYIWNIVKGLRVLDKHTNEGAHRKVYIKTIRLLQDHLQ